MEKTRRMVLVILSADFPSMDKKLHYLTRKANVFVIVCKLVSYVAAISVAAGSQ